MMTPQQTELFDQSVLRTLRDNNTLYGWSAPIVRNFVTASGFRNLDDDAIVFRCEYLTEKGLVKEVSKTISMAYRAWKITDAGRQYLDELNL